MTACHDPNGCFASKPPKAWRTFCHLLNPSVLYSTEKDAKAAVASGIATAVYRLRSCGQGGQAAALETLVERLSQIASQDNSPGLLLLLRCLLNLQRQPQQKIQNVLVGTKHGFCSEYEQSWYQTLGDGPTSPSAPWDVPREAGAHSEAIATLVWPAASKQDAALRRDYFSSIFHPKCSLRDPLISTRSLSSGHVSESTTGLASLSVPTQSVQTSSFQNRERNLIQARPSSASATMPKSAVSQNEDIVKLPRSCWEASWAQTVQKRSRLSRSWNEIYRQRYTPAEYFSAKGVDAFRRACVDNESSMDRLDATKRDEVKSQAASAIPQLESHELQRACSMVLQGIKSELFTFVRRHTQFCWAARHRLETSSSTMLSAMMIRFAETGTSCAQIEILCDHVLSTDKVGAVHRSFAMTLSMY
eukprot:SAG31_NODE_2325_length_5939_cov_5.827940_6_plen_417_part_01